MVIIFLSVILPCHLKPIFGSMIPICRKMSVAASFFADFLPYSKEKEAAGEHGWRPLGSLVYSEAELHYTHYTQWGIFNWIVASCSEQNEHWNSSLQARLPTKFLYFLLEVR